MNSAQRLHDLGQSLWLDNLSREILDDGTLARYVRDFSLTGLTSNPTIFDKAIRHTSLYDEAIRRAARDGASDEAIFFALALEDLRRAAELFRPAHGATGGEDGWVSLEVSPLLADDAAGTIAQVKALHQRAGIDNLFIKIPGTPAGIPAIEECLVAGIPINVTLLFSAGQYLAAAGAYQRAVERRLAAGLAAPVRSVASLFVSRWDVAVADEVPAALRNRLGIAVAQGTFRAYRQFHASPAWTRLAGAGAPPQRLLWASTGTKDPQASDVLYVEALAAPGTIDTMPDATLLALVDHGRIERTLSAERDGRDGDAVLARFEQAGVDVAGLAERLQREGAKAFVDSWTDLMGRIAAKRGEPASRAA
ncbi:MAG TPA: transaldolase [Casimicrobiaceae bacterium]|nr:transaldolase [Casimicrobiaceae bacterium]